MVLYHQERRFRGHRTFSIPRSLAAIRFDQSRKPNCFLIMKRTLGCLQTRKRYLITPWWFIFCLEGERVLFRSPSVIFKKIFHSNFLNIFFLLAAPHEVSHRILADILVGQMTVYDPFRCQVSEPISPMSDPLRFSKPIERHRSCRTTSRLTSAARSCLSCEMKFLKLFFFLRTQNVRGRYVPNLIVICLLVFRFRVN